MPTITPEMTQAEIGLKLNEVAEELVNGNGKLLIQITHTSKSNLSYRYKITLAYFGKNWAGEDALQFENLSYLLGAIWKENIYAGMFNELKGNGVGTDRYFLAAYNLGLTLKQYGLCSDPYEIATRGKYIEI